MDGAQGSLVAPIVEAAEAGELQEAAFCIIKAAQPAGSRARPYHEQYLRWLKQGPGVGEAYMQRAAIHNAAHCYLQVQLLLVCGCHHLAVRGASVMVGSEFSVAGSVAWHFMLSGAGCELHSCCFIGMCWQAHFIATWPL